MSGTKLELIVHPMCPYSQRALFSLAFKGIQADITHVSLTNPEPWFLELNPLGETPVLRVTKDERTHILTESLNISEYLDSFPGPGLYPRNSDGSLNHLEKGKIDVFIKLFITEFRTAFVGAYIQKTPEGIQVFKELLIKLNNLLKDGNYIAHEILGRNELTFADVMAFSFAERIVMLRDLAQDTWDEVNPTNVLEWFNRLCQEPWAQAHRIPENRLRNFVSKIISGGYAGLELPITNYD